MNKKLTALICITAILATSMLAACGADDMYSSGAGGSDSNEYAQYSREMSLAGEINTMLGLTDDSVYDMADYALEAPAEAPRPASAPAGSDTLATTTAQDFAEKIIYSYYADIETLAFDDTIASVEQLIALHGAFIENSNIQGTNYATSQRGGRSYRYAHFIIRVPVEQLSAVTGKLDSLGNVVTLNSNAQNITSQFYDTQSRLNSLRIQEERLLDMLTKAEDVADMLTIETTLADVRYQIESLTTTLNHWQQQVDYSTLTLSIAEVEEYQEPVQLHRTYWERMADGLTETLRSVGRFFMNLFMWIIVSAPVLIILAVIGIVAYVLIKRSIRKSRAKAEERRKNAAAANAQAYQEYYAPAAPPAPPVPQAPPEQPK